MEGIVYLIGAGPGDPGLITVRGLERLRQADVVVYDRLIASELLDEARPDAELIYAGKESSHHALPQCEINALLVNRAQQGKHVARLKGGDPFVFGRGGEEALALDAAHIPFEVIPGVTSAIAVPAYAGIPVTHRGIASCVTFVTGHEEANGPGNHIDWRALAMSKGTLIFFMGVSNLPNIVEALSENGLALDTPVAIIERGTTSAQRVVTGTLSNIYALACAAHIEPPALTVIGQVVSLHERLGAWIERAMFAQRETV